MPIPAPDCSPDVSPDVCCNTTWLIGERIRTVAWQGLVQCDYADLECGDREFRSYTTIGSTIQDPLGDSLIITMVSFAPSQTSARGNVQIAATHVANYRLELRDNGWPVIESDGQNILVPSAHFNNASKHAQSHGEKMYRALVNGIQADTIFPRPANRHIIDRGVAITPLIPLGPQGRQVGWGLNISVQMELR